MCGIAGEMIFGRAEAPLSNIERANARQLHRGPDSGGFYHLGNLVLGHRRLKIFDLTDRAAQPMVDHALGLALVFNGAIYNFPELRDALRAEGYAFTSDSDTEVLLKAYHAWGEPFVERLRGMFSFAIWERDSGKLILARDRLGIKPLYFAQTMKGFRFASTLQALLEFDGIDTSIDAHALHYYLMFHAVPEPLTIFSGIKKLSPGTIMVVEPNGETRQRCYWRFSFDPIKGRSEREWLADTKASLKLAVDRQMIADVPVGILLSGGLDSSLLVALAAEENPGKLETFSIGFESSGGEKGDEFYYSDLVAKHFNTRHHQLFISNKKLTDSLGECVKSMSEPMVSHDNIGFYLLSHEVAKHVKVVLSGQGADEMFAGYHWFQKIAQDKAGPADAASAIRRLIADRSYEEYCDTVSSDYRVNNYANNFLTRLSEKNGSEQVIDHLLEYESTFALANGPLGRVDNMTMAFSLEARVPLLDEAVIDLATRMPLSYKLPDGGKYILKKLGREMLPREVVDRPKGYFPVPALKYMHGPTLALMQEVLSPEAVKRRGIFNPEMVEKLLAEPDQHLTPSGGSKLWQLGLLEFWLQQQGV